MTDQPTRCEWCLGHPLYVEYHDCEWGVPVKDDRKLFEFLILEGAQAGLSWLTVLKKREGYRELFDQFDPEKIARYDERKISELKQNPKIIRNDLKIRAAISNAQALLKIIETGSSFSDYLWQFTDGRVIHNRPRKLSDLPATSTLSDTMSKVLKRDGFKFVGSTICYAHMQATGMINDHVVDCFRYRELGGQP